MGDFAQHSIKGSCLTALIQIFAREMKDSLHSLEQNIVSFINPFLLLLRAPSAEKLSCKLHFLVYWTGWTNTTYFILYILTFPSRCETVSDVVIRPTKSQVCWTSFTDTHGLNFL